MPIKNNIEPSLIDRAYQLKIEKDKIEEQLNSILSSFKEKNLANGEYFGDSGKLVVGERVDTILSPNKVYKMLGEKKFMEIVKVVKKDAEKYMSKSDMDKTALETKITKTYSLKGV